ncbi:MAG: gliding motility-associated C-terminal domain-containing protein, partial [Bacteroidetes bacterium]|nr:gliding motility-associated C-terminal domain-containing protein [Fibrella sp.]
MALLYPRFRWFLLMSGLLTGFCLTARASHIVGGELELQYLGPTAATTHRINLNLYFDDINGDPDAINPTLYVGIFRKRDDVLVGTTTLNFVSNQLIAYTKPACSINSLRTRLIRYTTTVSFPQANFSDPDGYYMTWERCCRNDVIDNIVTPGGAGLAFYLEFPNPWSNGRANPNSSPVFGEVNGDYACVQKPFMFDFSAKDPDGDSLTYSLVTPYNGFSTSDVPSPGSPNPITGR